jgi:hypothetical protein
MAVALVAGAAALSLACSTPTLPLPPPAALTYCPPNGMGIVRITGEVSPNAHVLARNADRCATDPMCGVIADADATGHFELEIAASIGDTIEIWQQIGTDLSPIFHLTIGPGPDASVASCP